MATHKVSIIILNWNKLEYTKQCVTSIEHNTRYQNYEIVLFDNGSTETGTKEYLSSLKHKVITNPVNLGFARGNNRAAAAAAEGELLLFLNNDTIVHANWLEEMVGVMQRDPDCGIAGSKLLYPDGTLQHIGVMFDHKGNRCHPFKKRPANIPEAAATGECEAVTGACLLIRKDIFERVGGFDEQYLHGSEDIDLCLKVRKLGLKVMYCSGSVLTHFEQVSLKVRGSRFKKRTTRQNNRLFFKKWGDTLDDFRLPNDLSGLKPYHYYHHTRSELLRLIPPGAKFILDVGCSSGMLGKTLKDSNDNLTVWGIEINGAIAQEAERRLDKVFVKDIEKSEPLFSEQTLFDCIIFADVLEHLRDPWAALQRFSKHLSPGGTVVCSIPNIQHYKIIKDLILDRWLYRAEGILDRDHVRFFSLATIKNMCAVSGYKIIAIERNEKAGTLLKVANRLLCNKLDKFLTQQYLIICERRGAR
ncbi:MAG: glycosyltransferase [Nitrospirae bacterium]|nr:glycosyltransferase [Nitrospirota bacterium]MCL5237429.1 glycosyltransferase [Nitrospirota bacterium]